MKDLILDFLRYVGWLEDYADEDAGYGDLWATENADYAAPIDAYNPQEGAPNARWHDSPQEHQLSAITPYRAAETDATVPFAAMHGAREHVSLKDAARRQLSRPVSSARVVDRGQQRPNIRFPTHHMCEVVVVDLKTLDEVTSALQELSRQKLIVVNVSCGESEYQQRFLDMLSGGASIINGRAEKVGETTFLFTPHSVNVTDMEPRLERAARFEGDVLEGELEEPRSPLTAAC